MSSNENFSEQTSNWFLILGALAFVGVALLPSVLYIIQLVSL